MVAFSDLYSLPTRAEIKARIITLAEDAGLAVTSWVLGDPSERWIEINARAIDQFVSNVTAQAVRAFFFELNTDPGDAGDLSADQTPRPGWLSAFMSGWWGVQRGNATYARGSLTVTNTGSTTATFAPFNLTFQRASPGSDGGYPTYRNDTDATVYTGLGGTLTLTPGASATIPIVCEQIGSYGSASSGTITVVVTSSFGTLTATNASPLTGSDREERATAIARARQQSAAASPNGPADAYRYASTTAVTGDPLQLWNGSGATSVTRVFVSPDSSTSAVVVYLANASGPASAVEVSSANANINGITLVDTDGIVHNPNPIGVVPDCVNLGPTISDGTTGAPGPAAAVAVSIGPLKGTARIKAIPGLGSADLVADVHEAIEAALAGYFTDLPIGGLDQTSGAGVVYTSDLQGTVRESYPVPVAGQLASPLLYAVTLTSPGTSTTALALGRVAVYVGPPAIEGAADNGSGLVRLTVDSSTVLTTSTYIQIYNAVTTGGLVLNGIWRVINIDPTHVDLELSTFPGGGVLTSASMSLILVTVVS